MKRFFAGLLLCLCSLPILAAKSIYIPSGWTQQSTGTYYEASSGITWKTSNSLSNDNIIILWDSRYTTAPNKLSTSSAYYVDLQDLLTKAENFYQLECNSLGFVNASTSNLSKYKVMILLNYTTDWVCTGAGYDYQVPALWLSPSTCKPVGSAVAHEVGHAFHYMCYAEASNHGATSGVETGFHSNWTGSNGQAIWETTANWQALQSYPEEFFTESYMYDVFSRSHNYAFSHEWHRYQAYPWLFYLCEKYNDITTIAQVWNQSETTVKDFNQVLMDNKGMAVSEFFTTYYDFAAKCVTWDMDVCRSMATSTPSYIGNFKYNCVKNTDGSYQVAYSSCPQSTGFNVIPLTKASAGTTVSVDFTALVPGCALANGDGKQYMNEDCNYVSTSATTYNAVASTYVARRGFNVGFVTLSSSGTRTYFGGNRIGLGTGEKTETVSFTVPSNVQKMWMVVVPTPSLYLRHSWDENIGNDDQWPYKFTLSGTSIGSGATVTQGSEDSNSRTLTVALERYTNLGYTASTVDVAEIVSNAVSFLGASSVSDCTLSWVDPDGTLVANPMTNYDGWASAAGKASTWASGDAAICVKFTPTGSGDVLTVCTYPGKDTEAGTIYTTTYALTYNSKQVNITLNTSLVDPPAISLSDYTIVGNYTYAAEAVPDSVYTATSVSLSNDAATIASLLGLSDLSSATFYGISSDGGLTSSYTANAGYWMDAEGIARNWGDNAPFFVETDLSTQLLFGQFPFANTGGETYKCTLYFGNESTKKLVQLNLTYKILSDTLVGDITKDGNWDVTDVTALVNIILGDTDNANYDYNAADLNGDGEYSVVDVTLLVDKILGK